ncbi:MAG: hypothetical protein ACRDJJ_01700, partial [Actinomycetota bacterium]
MDRVTRFLIWALVGAFALGGLAVAVAGTSDGDSTPAVASQSTPEDDGTDGVLDPPGDDQGVLREDD